MSTINQPATFDIVDYEEGEQQETELNGVLSELGVDNMEDILLKVYRTNELGKDAQCFDCTPDAINGIEDRLRTAYGKGDYKIKVFAPTPQGRKAVKRVIKLSLEAPEKPEVKPEEKSEDLKDVVSSMMVSMQQQQQNMMQMFRESQLESQNKTQELLITVLSKKDDGEKPPSLLETIQVLKSLEGDKKDPMETVLSMLNINREIKAELEQDKPAADGTMGQLMQGVNSLIELAKHAPEKQPAQNTQQLPDKSLENNTQQSPQPQPENQEQMNILVKQKLKSHLSVLNEKAKQGKNPALWADLTIDEIPEQFYPQLIAALGENDEEGFNTLLSINPIVAESKAWFMEFLFEVREAFTEKPEDEETEETDNGHENGEHLTKDTDSVDDSGKPSETVNDADKKSPENTD